MKKCASCILVLSLLVTAASAQRIQLRNDIRDSLPTPSLRILASNFYQCNTGFFCRKEWQLQRAVKIPVFFRLGSLDYCNALEGKNGTYVRTAP